MDGTDSFNTRQVLNRACLSQGVPWVFGGVSGFNGMVSVFIPGSGPCFECVIPPPGTKTPDPGIIGPAAGITASIQAMESLKFLLGKGKLLTGRLLKLSGLDMRISYMDFTPNPHCRVCSPDTTKKDLSDHGDHP